jgi:hypothetical protein
VKAYDLRAFFRRRGDALDGFIQIGSEIIARAHLYEPQPHLVFV